MPKTYNTIGTFTSGQILTAVQMNEIGTNTNNYRVPPIAALWLSTSTAVATASHTSFAGFTSTNGTEVIDTDGMITLSATASAITVQTAGVYQVSATTTWQANATGIRYARIVRSRSGTLVSYATSSLPNIGAGIEQQASLSGLIPCNAGDLIRLMVYQDSGGNLNLLSGAPGDDFGGTRLSAVWVGQVS
jgi:hypothetical protein